MKMSDIDYSTKNSITLNIKSSDDSVKPLKITITKKTPQIFYQLQKRIEQCNSPIVVCEILIEQMCSRSVSDILTLQDKHYPGLFQIVSKHCLASYKSWYTDKFDVDDSVDITIEEE